MPCVGVLSMPLRRSRIHILIIEIYASKVPLDVATKNIGGIKQLRRKSGISCKISETKKSAKRKTFFNPEFF